MTWERAGLVCSADTPHLDDVALAAGLKTLEGWAVRGQTIFKRYDFKGFAKATQMANLVAWHSDRTGHHADISFGWGYCEVVYTSHEAGGITAIDLECALKLEALLG